MPWRPCRHKLPVENHRESPKNELKANLRRTSDALFAADAPPALALPELMLRQALRVGFPDLTFAVVLDHIPEQSEDIWYMLIDVDHVAIIEVPRLRLLDVRDILIQQMTRRSYEKRLLGKQKKRQLRAAIELILERIAG